MKNNSQTTKVTHIITLLELGGAQGNTIYTVQHLDPEQFDSYLLSGKGAYWDKEISNLFPKSTNVEFLKNLIRPIHPIRDLLAIFEIARVLRKIKPTILHTHSSKAGILGRLAGKLVKVPIIVHTYHGFGFNDQQSRFLRWTYIQLEKFVAPFCKKLIFVSKSNQETAHSLGIGRLDQYEIIRSGVHLKEMSHVGLKVNANNLRSSLGIPDSSKIVVSVGAFKPQKNLIEFVDFAHKLEKKHSDVHFLIIGDGLLRSHIEQRIFDLNMVEKFHLPGWRRDISEILAISDVFVLTSLWEGLPRALVEAMAMGIPPVCFATDGVKDLLGSSEGGVMVKQGDINSMSDNVHKLLIDSTFWSNTSKFVKEQIGIEFDIDHMVTQQEMLYTGLLRQIGKNPSDSDISSPNHKLDGVKGIK